jgi:hypothetical protein
MLEILQTVAMCISSIALVVIAISVILMTNRLLAFLPPLYFIEGEEDVDTADNEDGSTSPKMGRTHGRRKK